jgi:membrane-associated phospholipid phosphatase
MKALLIKNRTFFAPFLCVWVIVLALVLASSKFEQMTWINSHRTTWTDTFFWCATQLGEGWFFGAVIFIHLFIRYEKALILAMALLVSTLMAQGFKFLCSTLRPITFFEGIDYPWHFVEGVNIHSYNSFPSGHTTSAFCIFTLLTLFTSNKKWGYLYLILALLAAYSRPYLFQHFPEDLLGGSLIGILSALITRIGYPSLSFHQNKDWPQQSLIHK